MVDPLAGFRVVRRPSAAQHSRQRPFDPSSPRLLANERQEMTTSVKAGRYRLLEELGRGAMGIVYRAQDPVIGRTVAVKTLHVVEHGSGLSPEELLRRFHTEARAAGLLSHPNIVAVYDAGKEDDFFYITMELVEGKSLQDLLGERHAFPLARVLRLMQQACSALEFAHQHNVIHRDIKPANLILTPSDTLKISDFGTAKILQFQNAQTGQIIGTPSYMSPEQIKGRPVDGRSDIFSLGGVLYQLLTGQKPFPGDSVTAVIYKIVSEEPPPPRDLDSSIHPGLSAIVMRALAKAPGARFQSCVEFFDALQNYRDYEPGRVPPPPPEPASYLEIEPPISASLPSPDMLAGAAVPQKQGGSIWLALFLLAVIAAAGYKVWPPLRELWLRSQPPPVVRMPSEPVSENVTPAGAPPARSAAAPVPASPQATPAAASRPPAVVPVAAPVTATPAASQATPPATVVRRPATVSATAPRRQPARPALSPAAAEWRQLITQALNEAGLGDRVQIVAAGNTLTLGGKLNTSSHRYLLDLLKGTPANIQIVDHIEFAEETPEASVPPTPSELPSELPADPPDQALTEPVPTEPQL
jgi:serine/threonine-protein kinase